MDLSPWVYIVLLGAAAVLYGWFLPARKGQSGPENGSIGDVEATLEQYMAEIERENQEIVNLIGQTKQETTAKQLAQQEQVAELRQRLADNERLTSALESRLGLLENAAAPLAAPSAEAAAGAAEEAAVHDSAAEEPVPEPEVHEPTVRERYTQLFELYDQGKSIDMVAKATGMAQGEVQLILQLARREEAL